MKPSTRSLTRFVFLTALTLSIEMMGLPQPFTGPLINMMLIITSLIINPGAGVILGLFTPILAALRGQLPPPLVRRLVAPVGRRAHEADDHNVNPGSGRAVRGGQRPAASSSAATADHWRTGLRLAAHPAHCAARRDAAQ